MQYQIDQQAALALLHAALSSHSPTLRQAQDQINALLGEKEFVEQLLAICKDAGQKLELRQMSMITLLNLARDVYRQNKMLRVQSSLQLERRSLCLGVVRENVIDTFLCIYDRKVELIAIEIMAVIVQNQELQPALDLISCIMVLCKKQPPESETNTKLLILIYEILRNISTTLAQRSKYMSIAKIILPDVFRIKQLLIIKQSTIQLRHHPHYDRINNLAMCMKIVQLSISTTKAELFTGRTQDLLQSCFSCLEIVSTSQHQPSFLQLAQSALQIAASVYSNQQLLQSQHLPTALKIQFCRRVLPLVGSLLGTHLPVHSQACRCLHSLALASASAGHLIRRDFPALLKLLLVQYTLKDLDAGISCRAVVQETRSSFLRLLDVVVQQGDEIAQEIRSQVLAPQAHTIHAEICLYILSRLPHKFEISPEVQTRCIEFLQQGEEVIVIRSLQNLIVPSRLLNLPESKKMNLLDVLMCMCARAAAGGQKYASLSYLQAISQVCLDIAGSPQQWDCQRSCIAQLLHNLHVVVSNLELRQEVLEMFNKIVQRVPLSVLFCLHAGTLMRELLSRYQHEIDQEKGDGIVSQTCQDEPHLQIYSTILERLVPHAQLCTQLLPASIPLLLNPQLLNQIISTPPRMQQYLLTVTTLTFLLLHHGVDVPPTPTPLHFLPQLLETCMTSMASLTALPLNSPCTPCLDDDFIYDGEEVLDEPVDLQIETVSDTLLTVLVSCCANCLGLIRRLRPVGRRWGVAGLLAVCANKGGNFKMLEQSMSLKLLYLLAEAQMIEGEDISGLLSVVLEKCEDMKEVRAGILALLISRQPEGVTSVAGKQKIETILSMRQNLAQSQVSNGQYANLSSNGRPYPRLYFKPQTIHNSIQKLY